MNLLKNRGRGGSSGQTGTANTNANFDTSFQTETIVDSSSSSTKDNVIKVILIIAGTGMLMAYESYNIDQLRAQEANITAQNQELANELEQKKPIADKAKELQKNIRDLESRIKSIKDLSKVRLREIRSIDFIQNSIPERIWLTKVEFDDGGLKIEGGTLSDEHLNRFIESLESNTLFKNVILLRAVEQKSKDGTVKVFLISSNVLGTE